MDKYIVFGINSKKTVPCVLQKGSSKPDVQTHNAFYGHQFSFAQPISSLDKLGLI